MAFQAKLPLCVSPQMLSSLPGGLCELLRSLHVHSLKNDEVLLLRDSRRLAEFRDAGPQVGCRPFIMKESAQFRVDQGSGRGQETWDGEREGKVSLKDFL